MERIMTDKKTNVNAVCTLRCTHLVYVVIILSCVHQAAGRKHNNPEYPMDYLIEDCHILQDSDIDNAATWFGRVKNLTVPGSKQYGYIRATENDFYEGPKNCAIRIQGPNSSKIVIRIPRIEIYHDHTACDKDYMSIIGATNKLDYCGFGTVSPTISSTANWLIIRIKVSESNFRHDYIGFSLYYTAVRLGRCNDQSLNATEWDCGDGCIPDELSCDGRDNCGGFDEETVAVCGLSKGAIAGISVVSVLIGGTVIFLIGFCIFNKKKETRIRQQRQRRVTSTNLAGFTARGTPSGPTVISSATSNGQVIEPPPPYTPVAYTNYGLYESPEGDANIYQSINDANPINQSDVTTGNETRSHDSVTVPNGTATTPNGHAVNGTPGNFSVSFTNASSLRPAMGEPPPLYTAGTDGGGVQDNEGATGGGDNTGGVSFDPLPQKGPDS